MKPIAIVRHAATEGPGYLADFLDEHRLPWQLIAIDEGAPPPTRARDWAGLVFMGGPMSVNDDLPWIAPVLQLIREAVAAGVPVLGHCLGGQLMSRALGGQVSRNPYKEIGWGTVELVCDERQQPLPQVEALFAPGTRAFAGFHWHGETFSLPAGATHILRSAHCEHQGFVLGPHIGLQCHIEMTEAMIHSWCQHGAEEISSAADSPAVQSTATILQQNAVHLRPLQEQARHLYRWWIRHLRHD